MPSAFCMKVLIVDDHPESVAVAEARLAGENVTICSALDGAAGLEAARREKPDLILLDVDMPDMSGFDVCRALKADVELCMIPVLFLSGSGNLADKVQGLDLGAVDYVTKPFDSFELRARVRAALRNKRLQDLLIEHAQVDPLTGLCNRRALLERLHETWARVQRHGGHLSFIIADVDHFKQINDTYGHSLGDAVLQEIAQSIFSQCRQVDMPARYGGDEFVILVPDENARGAARLAERCRRQIEQAEVSRSGQTVRTTASFGVADADGVPTPEALIEEADRALYRAKKIGGNQVQVQQEVTVPT